MTCGDHSRHSPKVSQQGPRADHGNARNSREHGLGYEFRGRFQLLRVHRPIPARSCAIRSQREKPEPDGRILVIPAEEERNALTDHRQTRTADRLRPQRAAVEVEAFDEQIWEARRHPQLAYLPPKSSALEREVEIGDGLPLDQYARAEVVVSDGEPAYFYVETLRAQRFHDAAVALERVGNDPAHWTR
jgi:hypothetical protein